MKKKRLDPEVDKLYYGLTHGKDKSEGVIAACEIAVAYAQKIMDGKRPRRLKPLRGIKRPDRKYLNELAEALDDDSDMKYPSDEAIAEYHIALALYDLLGRKPKKG